MALPYSQYLHSLQYKEGGCFLFKPWLSREVGMFSHSLRTSILAGNPGVPEYYQQFMHTLWKKSGEKIPVWCVGQAGHVIVPSQPALGWTDIGE